MKAFKLIVGLLVIYGSVKVVYMFKDGIHDMELYMILYGSILVLFIKLFMNKIGSEVILDGLRHDIPEFEELGIPIETSETNGNQNDEEFSHLIQTSETILEPENEDSISNYSSRKEKFVYKQPILYLRSFTIDGKVETTFLHGLEMQSSYESMLMRFFKDVGPVMSLSNPDSDYLGGTQIIVGTRDWKKVFYSQVNNSKHIIWHWGLSKHLLWELNYLITEVPQKLVIIFPVDGTDEERQLLWNVTIWKLSSLNYSVRYLPINIAQTYFIVYNSDREYFIIEKKNDSSRNKVFNLFVEHPSVYCLQELRKNLGYPQKQMIIENIIFVLGGAMYFYIVMILIYIVWSLIFINLILALIVLIILILIFFYAHRVAITGVYVNSFGNVSNIEYIKKEMESYLKSQRIL